MKPWLYLAGQLPLATVMMIQISAATPSIALVPKARLDELRSSISTDWQLVAFEEASSDQMSQALAVMPPVEAVSNRSHLSEVLNQMTSGRLFQWSMTGVDLLDFSVIPAHFAVCDVHQGGVAIPEYILAAVMSWNVRLPQLDATVRSCTWRSDLKSNCPPSVFHRQTRGQTIGIVGLGTIGMGLAKLATSVGMRAIAVTSNVPSTIPPYMSWVGSDDQLPTLLTQADFVVLCVPLLPSTRGLIGTEALHNMKPDGVLINIARGPVVDEDALYEALVGKTIGGAILDVWWNDFFFSSKQVGWPSKCNFSIFSNVWMTPHASSMTPEAHQEGLEQVGANLQRLHDGQPLINIVRNASAEIAI